MSALRARCPDCRTLTAVAIGPEYQCHSCGREFAAGLVRVALDGDPAFALLDVPWPEALVVDAAAPPESLARELPKRPLVLASSPAAHDLVAAVVGSGYVRFDAPPPDPAAAELELAGRPTPAGAGFSGFPSSPEGAALVTRLAHALGL